MWILATIVGYHTIRVWFMDVDHHQTDALEPGVYILKGETNLKQFKFYQDIKCKRLVVPCSYFRHTEVVSWTDNFMLGYPVPFEYLCLPILTTKTGQWIDPNTNTIVYQLTKNTTPYYKLNPQHRIDDDNDDIKSSSHKRFYKLWNSCALQVESIIVAHSHMLPYCDDQFRKVVLLCPIDLVQQKVVCNIYCYQDDCYEFYPCSQH